MAHAQFLIDSIVGVSNKNAADEQLDHRLAREERYDLIAVAFPEPWSEATRDRRQIPWLGHVLEHAACPGFVAVPPGIPTKVDA